MESLRYRRHNVICIKHAIGTTRGPQVILRERDREETDPERPASCHSTAGAARARIRPTPRRSPRRRDFPNHPGLPPDFPLDLAPVIGRPVTEAPDPGALPRAWGPVRPPNHG